MSSKRHESSEWRSALDSPKFNGTFPPVGHCIYCCANGKMTREHIVPEGLGGNLKLPKSSCESCRRITEKIEFDCLRWTLFRLRVKHKFKTKHPDEWPTEWSLEVSSPNGETVSLTIPSSELPSRSWALPAFNNPPGILTLAKPEECREFAATLHVDKTDAARLHEYARTQVPFKNHQTDIVLGRVDLGTFCRMLAKIGHAFACAVLRPDGFEPYLQDFILNECPHPGYWIGEDEGVLSDQTFWRVSLDQIQGKDGSPHLCARIRLFGFANTPSYIVVVGKGASNKLALLQYRGCQQSVDGTFVKI